MITTSSQPSSSEAPWVIRSPPPNDGPLPTATSIASTLAHLAVELEGVGQRLEDPQLGQRRQVVAHLAARPGHRVGALVDHRVEAGGQHGHEVRAPRCGPGRSAGSGEPTTTSAAACGSLRGQVEVARDVVAGAGGDDPERGLGAGERLHGEVHHAVAADHHEALDAVGDAALGQVERLVGVAARPGCGRGSRPPAAAAARSPRCACPRPLPEVGFVRSAISLATPASLRGGRSPVRRDARVTGAPTSVTP